MPGTGGRLSGESCGKTLDADRSSTKTARIQVRGERNMFILAGIT